QKSTGAIIEIFLLNPVEPSTVISQVMETTDTCTWACMIGNKKKWKGEVLSSKFEIQDTELSFNAELVDSEKNYVKFSWKSTNQEISDNPKNQSSFAEIVRH
ncbi:MAG: S-adenosylmethionine:tRNA ribosyltransferase-isomerase, partial [Spirosomaceae bacterium]|nr:S-adenosylmethionine:tRNA ribosyltransferase-isomerase [Spirosomataceae bacterium]